MPINPWKHRLSKLVRDLITTDIADDETITTRANKLFAQIKKEVMRFRTDKEEFEEFLENWEDTEFESIDGFNFMVNEFWELCNFTRTWVTLD